MFLLLCKRKRSRHTQNYIWIYRSDCNAYQGVNHTHSIPTAVLLQNQSCEDSGSQYWLWQCLLSLQSFTASSLPVSRRHQFPFPLGQGIFSQYFISSTGCAATMWEASVCMSVLLKYATTSTFQSGPAGTSWSWGKLDGDPHPPLPWAQHCSSGEGGCPALPCGRFSQLAACFQPAPGAFHLSKPWTPCWRVQLQACLLLLPAGFWPCQNCHWSLSPAWPPHPWGHGLWWGHSVPQLSQPIEQPYWYERKGVSETAEIIKRRKNWQKRISASSVFSLPGLAHLTAALSQESVSSCLVHANWQTQILP